MRDFIDPACNAKGRRIFRHHIQWVCNQLKEKGLMSANAEKDHWIIADAGYHRVGKQQVAKEEHDFI